MPLTSGTKVGVYEVGSPLGAGGMGEVYRARDTKLRRDVAIKVLRQGADGHSLARFEREAQLLASLDHPNIARIYAIEKSTAGPALVMELVEGPTLQDSLARGPVPVEESLAIARQVADALAAAHERGIVHRDLKPANVKLTAAGTVKVLDFGLAKRWEDEAHDGGTEGATVTAATTHVGAILGTAAYMSPEQARGKPVDRRTDIWSFGCLLFELLTGRQAFPGDTISDSIAAVLERDPDWARLPPATPQAVRLLLRSCLRKDADDRPDDARRVCVALDRALEEPRDAATAASPRWFYKRWLVRLAALAVVAVAAFAAWALWSRSPARAGFSPIRSIAVLPFENLSGDPAQEYFVDGISDAITVELGKIRGFDRVISWQSMKRYKRTTETAEEIAKDVGVDALVGGVVIRENTRVRISPRLIAVRPERQLWAQTYDRELREILSLHTEVARAIAGEVLITLGQAQPVAPAEVNAEAYDFYLKGRHYFEQRFTEAPLRTSVQMFERALALDPGFARAHASLAVAHGWLWFNYWDRTDEGRRAAMLEAATAVRLAPNSAEAHAAQAWVHYQVNLDYRRALEEFTVAQRLNPSDADVVHGMGMIARRQGRIPEAIALTEKALALSPNDALICFNLAVTYAFDRRYDEAEPRFQRAVSLRTDGQFFARRAWFELLAGWPDIARASLTEARAKATRYFLDPYYWYQVELTARDYPAALAALSMDDSKAFEWQWFFVPKALLRAQVHALTGQPDAARREFEAARVLLEAKLHAEPEDDRLLSSLGVAYAGLGRRPEALEAGRKGVALMPMEKEAWRATYRAADMARIFMMVGDIDAAIKQLDYVLSIPSEVSIAGLVNDPTWTPVTASPSFKNLVRKYSR